jgi:hypothetical protein
MEGVGAIVEVVEDYIYPDGFGRGNGDVRD